MNLFELVLKQMRQRALSTWLTMLSVVLGVGLAIAIMILRAQGASLFAQTDFGYDLIIGPPKGSPLQLTLNTVYQIDQSPGIIPYAIYADMIRKGPALPGHADYRPYVRSAVPIMVGDSYQNRRIVGTSPQMFGFDDNGKPVEGTKWQYRMDKSFELADGRVFAPRKFEAVIGSDIASSLHLHLYDENKSEEENLADGGAFRATHGLAVGGQPPDIHKPKWRIVGILQPTHTANDHVLFIPFISLYAISEHETGMIDQALSRAKIDPTSIPPDQLDSVLSKLGIDPNQVPESLKRKFQMKPKVAAPVDSSTDLMQPTSTGNAAVSPSAATMPAADDEPEVYHLDEHGDIVPDLPQAAWELSAILVQSRGGFQAQELIYDFKIVDDRATAVNPASVMRQFFDTFLSNSTLVLFVIALLVTVVAAVGILVSIYNSVSARQREIAILRALGATRGTVLQLICTEAATIGFFGALLGLVAGHLLSAVGSFVLQRTIGEGINWWTANRYEWAYLGLVVIITAIAGLVPAMKAYSTPVATNLVGN